MPDMGSLEKVSVGFEEASPLKVGSSLFADEMWQLRSQRSQLEHANLLLRSQLENIRLAQENSFLQQQLHERQMQSWVSKVPAKNMLAASIAKGCHSHAKPNGGPRGHAAKHWKHQQMTSEPTLPHSFACSEQSTTDTSSLPVSFTCTDTSFVVGDTSSSENDQTTCMMRNLPEDFSRQSLLDLIDSVGFEGKYSLVYLPMDFKNKTNLGYAFVDLVSGDVAKNFFEAFTGFCDRGFSIEKECEVCWSTVQGYHAHVERYRNSPVMHPLVPDDFKPLLFVDGQQVPFPEPTKRIREPRNWKRTQD